MQINKLSEHLSLPKPWTIYKVNEDKIRKHLTVELTCDFKKRGLFNSTKDVICPLCQQKTEWIAKTEYLIIRDINLDDYKIYLRVPDLKLNCMQGDANCPMRLYSNPNVPYSRLLEQKIREFCNMSNGTNTIAKELQLNPDELEQLIEYGWLSRAGTIPPASHPIWQAVITNQIQVKTQNLGLQCLLIWANGQLKRSNLSDNERLDKINLVRSYFEKYRNTLQSELDQVLNAIGGF